MHGNIPSILGRRKNKKKTKTGFMQLGKEKKKKKQGVEPLLMFTKLAVGHENQWSNSAAKGGKRRGAYRLRGPDQKGMNKKLKGVWSRR